MDIKSYFKIIPGFDLTAAQIGISKWDWISIDCFDEDKARQKMSEHRFDVLPIVDNDGKISGFYCTREWNNYQSLNQLPIGEDATIYYRTSFLDLIKKFHEKKRHFFFLSDYENILGLVSLVNLNDPLVYNYLYQVLADIERKFSLILKKSPITEAMILDYWTNSDDSHLRDLARSYNLLKSEGMESTIYERMYFQTVGSTFSHFIKHVDIEYKKLKKYSVKMSGNGTYNTLRNNIMHPVKTLITSPRSLNDLNEVLVDYEVIRSFEV